VKFVLFRSMMVALALAAVTASVALAGDPHVYVYRDVAFVTMTGHGTVTSMPRGVNCPKRCRGVFVRGTHVILKATPAAGWKLASFTSKWCKAANAKCGFDLVSPHDCSGGACPLGAFGVIVHFARR
jgi:hypothetical protein